MVHVLPVWELEGRLHQGSGFRNINMAENRTLFDENGKGEGHAALLSFLRIPSQIVGPVRYDHHQNDTEHDRPDDELGAEEPVQHTGQCGAPPGGWMRRLCPQGANTGSRRPAGNSCLVSMR